MSKVIIVEGKTDKEKLIKVINEPVSIVCTQGTLSNAKLEELRLLEDQEMYILVDADESGEKLRRLLKQEFPNAYQLYTDRAYREVATTPCKFLAVLLSNAHFKIKTGYLVDD